MTFAFFGSPSHVGAVGSFINKDIIFVTRMSVSEWLVDKEFDKVLT